jgi:hypothetical protein
MTISASSRQRSGGIAALCNVVVASATLVVALVWIGPEAILNRRVLMQMAVSNPAPLFVQDLLKLAAAMISVALILAFDQRLRVVAPKALLVAGAFGFASVSALVVNAALSAYAVMQATASQLAESTGEHLNAIVGILGMAVVMLNGVWYLLASRVALRTKTYPKRLAQLGLVIGGMSLVPPLAIAVLILSIAWSTWVARVLLDPQPAGQFE